MIGYRENIIKNQTILLWVILFQFGSLFSQDIVFEHFSSNNGLSNNLIRDIIQDQDGYLWFATSGGLNRFDGHYFDIYKPTPGDTLSLSNSRITELMLDQRGFLWARSSLGNFHRIDSKTKEVLNLKELGILPVGTRVLDHKLSHNGDLWLQLNSGILRIYYTGKSSDQFEYQYFNSDNQLPENTVYFIYPDSFHSIWIGTSNGLVRMKVSPDDPGSMHSEVFFEDFNESFFSVIEKENKVFFGTETKGLIFFNHETDSFEKVESEITQPRGSVIAMRDNYRDEILFSTDMGGAIFYDPSSESYEYFEHFNTPGLDEMIIAEIFTDSYGIFWMITDKRGIYQFDPEREKFKYFGLNFENRIFLGEPDKQVILEDSNRNLWIGINGGGLFFYDREGNDFIQFQHNAKNTNSISSDIVLSLYEDKSKNLWIGTSYGGINKVSLKKDEFHRILPVENPTTGFDNYVRSVIADPLGHVYIGTKAGKIYVYRGDKKIGTIPDDLYDPTVFPASNIYCLYFDDDYNLWVGTKGSGLYIFKSLLGYFNNLKHPDIEVVQIDFDPGSENSLSTGNIYSIVRDNYGQYWIASFEGGLYMLSNPFEETEIRHFIAGREDDGSIVSDHVRHLLLDHDHNLWIATSEGISILENMYLETEKKQFINLRPSQKNSSDLSGKVVYQTMQAQNKDIYVATLDGGINQLKMEDFNRREFNWIHHTSPILSSNVYGIEEDDNGNIWMGTDNGLFRLVIEENTIERFWIGKSAIPPSFSESCAERTSKNEMIFGSNDGFIMFHPSKIHKDSTQFPIKFSRLEINGEQISSTNSDILDQEIDAQESIELDHVQRNITLHFSVLDFDNHSAIQYSYFLEGFDNYWSNPSTINYANYRQLAPGDYILHVRGTNSSGAWMDQEAFLKIIINPPFLKSSQGAILIIIIVLILMITTIFISYKQVNNRNKVRVERAITEKRIEYYTNISHEFKTPLSLILNPVEEIINSHKSSDFSKQKGSEIKKNATYLKRLIDQILDFRKLREGKMQLKIRELDLIEFFREIYLIFLPLSKNLGIKFEFEFNMDQYPGYADIRQLEKVTYNLLSNAFRHTPTGKTVRFSIDISEAEKRLFFMVEDQGTGIAEDELPKIFDRFYMSKSSTGIGLFFTKELVFLHKGEIEAVNKPEGGTVFSISIPVDRNSYSIEEMATSEEDTKAFDFNSIDDIETIVSNASDVENEPKHFNKNMSSILIVEDNDEMRKYLSNELSKKFNVNKASNGREGLALTLDRLPDLVLSDVKMPEMDGYELTKAIKKSYITSHIPVILLTSESSEEAELAGTASGADDFIAKPFKLNNLLMKIEKTIIQRKKLIQRLENEDLVSVSNEKIKENDDSDFILTVQKLINQNISNSELNVQFLVKKLGVSRTLFFKNVKSSIGFSPNEYIRITRMKSAAHLLSSSRKTINEIGFVIGYNDPNYFSKAFKKHYGITPSEYRSQAGKN